MELSIDGSGNDVVAAATAVIVLVVVVITQWKTLEDVAVTSLYSCVGIIMAISCWHADAVWAGASPLNLLATAVAHLS